MRPTCWRIPTPDDKAKCGFFRLVEHADAELATCCRSREASDRTLGGMCFPRIDLTVRLGHLRKHSKQPPQEQILALLDPLLNVIAGGSHIALCF